MNSFNYYLDVLKKYAVFSGRASRAEYWYFFLFNTLISLALELITFLFSNFSNTVSQTGVGLLSGLYAIGVFIPTLAVTVRRLHDTNRSGWWILINLIPVIGWIVLIVFLLQDSKPGENKYGKNPKEALKEPEVKEIKTDQS